MEIKCLKIKLSQKLLNFLHVCAKILRQIVFGGQASCQFMRLYWALCSSFYRLRLSLQEGKSAGLSGAIAGGAETFFGKNKSRTIESKLVLVTKIVAVSFFVLALVATLLLLFL